jgi:hypothetical protein
MKRAMYFTLDGILAATIIVSAVFLYMTFSTSEQDSSQLQATASDAVNILNTMTVSEVNSPLTSQVLATNLVTENDTVIRAIGVLWATNNPLAQNFTEYVMSDFSPRYSYAVYLEGTLLMNRSLMLQSQASKVTAAKQQISGVAQSKPLAGNTATSFLKRLENKSTSSFAYLGGFIGQGNITVILNLPSDVDSTRVQNLLLELDTPQEFALYINNQYCTVFTPSTPEMIPDAWNASACINSLVTGDNTFKFVYANLTNAYT